MDMCWNGQGTMVIRLGNEVVVFGNVCGIVQGQLYEDL